MKIESFHDLKIHQGQYKLTYDNTIYSSNIIIIIIMTAVTTVPTTNVSTTIAAASDLVDGNIHHHRMRNVMGGGINNSATDSSSSNNFCQVCHPSSQYRNRNTVATTTTPTVTNLKRCQQCRLVYYCSQQCQKIDWKYHRTICVRHKNNTHNGNNIMENVDVPSTSSSSPAAAVTAAAPAAAVRVVTATPPSSIHNNSNARTKVDPKKNQQLYHHQHPDWNWFIEPMPQLQCIQIIILPRQQQEEDVDDGSSSRIPWHQNQLRISFLPQQSDDETYQEQYAHHLATTKTIMMVEYTNSHNNTTILPLHVRDFYLIGMLLLLLLRLLMV
jgi:MYND finger